MSAVDQDKLRAFYESVRKDAESGGYNLNPDSEFTVSLLEGMLTNQERYGYPSCPCRLAAGQKDLDLDMICPCDYRDPDLDEFGACYCALYVTGEVLRGEKKLTSIPERRPGPAERAKQHPAEPSRSAPLPYPVWRCKVCGYLCARNEPPEICPICKVKKDRFERFM